MKYVESNRPEDITKARDYLRTIKSGNFDLGESTQQVYVPGGLFSKPLSYNSIQKYIRTDNSCITLIKPENPTWTHEKLYRIRIEALYGTTPDRLISGAAAKELTAEFESALQEGFLIQQEWPKKIPVVLAATEDEEPFEGFVVVDYTHAECVAGSSALPEMDLKQPFRLARTEPLLKAQVFTQNGTKIDGAYAKLSSYTVIEKDEETGKVNESISVFAEVVADPMYDRSRRTTLDFNKASKFDANQTIEQSIKMSL